MKFYIPSNDNELFKECIEALGANVKILLPEESEKMWILFEKMLPVPSYMSRIDWNIFEKKNIQLDSIEQIIPILYEWLGTDVNLEVFVFWNDALLPVLKTDVITVLKAFDHVISCGFETWLYNPTEGYIIEYYYLGELHVGLLPKVEESEIIQK